MEFEISNEESNYMYNFVKRIVNEIGPRMSCSPAEAKAAQFIKKEFEEICDDAKVEPFTCHPKAFLGWIKLVVIMTLVSMIIYLIMQTFTNYWSLLLLSIISFSLVLLPIVIIWREFFNYKEFIDFLFKKKKSQNVIGVLNAKGERERIMMFSGHMDSAIEFKLQKVLGYGFIPIAFAGIIIMLLWVLFSLLTMIFMIFGLLGFQYIFLNMTIWLLIIGSPCLVALFFFVPLGDKGNVVPGAVDNLSSCAVIQGLARYLKKNSSLIPANTEIRLISFGCEEAGLRGAFRYAAAHKEELLKYNTMLVNMDGLETPDMFHSIEFEPTTKTWHSKEVVDKLVEAAKSVGIEAPKFGAGKLERTVGKLSGGSDAAAFSKAGIKAGFINSADWKTRSSYYHQSGDTPDKIRPGTLENALRICLAFLKNESEL